jgi:signal transduction histidine kinase
VVKLGHQGLANTRERTAQISGTLSIVSRPGGGTSVFIRAPVEPT